MPVVDGEADEELVLKYQNQQRVIRPTPEGTARSGGEPDLNSDPDCVMLVRPRRSRIYFMRSFFDYPLSNGGHTSAFAGIQIQLPLLDKVRSAPAGELAADASRAAH
jgi:hypothetical protein